MKLDLNKMGHFRTLAGCILVGRTHSKTARLINTGALARCTDAHSTWELFQQFAKPLKRLGRRSAAEHRAKALAKASVLMRICWKAYQTCAVSFLVIASSSLAATHYVDLNSTNATPPYTDWSTAATNIQAAVDAALAADEIVVTNGTYSPLVVDKQLSLRSVNGPQVTAIHGGSLYVRCVYLANGASLAGFTLAGGSSSYGGGAFGGTLSNCTLSGNAAYVGGGSDAFGGGAYDCTLNNCTLSGNVAYAGRDFTHALGGGAYGCTLNNCTLNDNQAYISGEAYALGGGAYQCALNNCTLARNSAEYIGGGAAFCTLSNCAVSGNSAFGYYNNGYYVSSSAGGAYASSLYNCTVTGNSADQGGALADRGAGAYNCIFFANTNRLGCEDCGAPGSLAGNDWYGDPLFVDTNGWANLRLQSNSPCINAGDNAYAPAGPDLDGNPRIAGGTVDIGAYEFQSPASQISYAWLQQFGLLTDGSADLADPDGDGMNNWQEWICGTDPTNALSVLRLVPPSPAASGVNVTWQSVSTRIYVLERSSNLAAPPAFTLLATNIAGQTGMTTFIDTNAVGAGPWFYRVGVGR